LIKDHINMIGVNPLIGKFCSFVDMRDCYNEKLRNKFMGLAYKHDVKIQ